MDVAPRFDQIFKIVLTGNSSVGKTSLLSRFIHDELPTDITATVGVQFSKRVMKNNIRGTKVQLHLWDTAGQERYKALTTHHYRGANGAIVVFDITCRKSFDQITRWIQEVRDHSEEGCVIFMIGNKCDLDQKIAPASLISAGLNSTNHSRNPTFSLQNNSFTDNSISFSRIKSDRARSGTSSQLQTFTDEDLIHKIGGGQHREVSQAEAQYFADKMGVNYFETSAMWGRRKGGEGQGIELIIEQLIESKRELQIDPMNEESKHYYNYPRASHKEQPSRIKLQTNAFVIEEKNEKSCCVN